tara:strand:- start:2503 stop:2904 length:402 start_codon:yes stop_codon:yes gene_type:complete
METIIWVVLSVLIGLAIFQAFSLKKLKKEFSNCTALLNHLAFKHQDSTEFFANRIAGIYYDFCQRSANLIFFPSTSLEEVLTHKGAKEILIKRKMIRKKDKGPFKGTLAERAQERKLSLVPILIALNDLEDKS